MKTLMVAGVPVDIVDGPISVSFSGGADSSLLLYLLMKEAPGPINVFTLDDGVKHYRNSHYTRQVLAQLRQWFPRADVSHTITDVPHKTREALLALWYAAPHTVYDATTCVPPAHVLRFFPYLAPDVLERRSPNQQRPVHWGNKFIGPFTNIDKSRVAAMYDDLGLTDTLFPLTCSCEAFLPEPLVQHCGECWWCRERRWAFGRLS